MHMYPADSVEAVLAAAARASLRLERNAEAIIDTGISHNDPQRGEGASGESTDR